MSKANEVLGLINEYKGASRDIVKRISDDSDWDVGYSLKGKKVSGAVKDAIETEVSDMVSNGLYGEAHSLEDGWGDMFTVWKNAKGDVEVSSSGQGGENIDKKTFKEIHDVDIDFPFEGDLTVTVS